MKKTQQQRTRKTNWGRFPTSIFLRTVFFSFFGKELPVWWGRGGGGPSIFWKLLSSLENNFQRPEVFIIIYFSCFFFQFLILFLQNMDRFFKHVKVPYLEGLPDFRPLSAYHLTSERPWNVLLYLKNENLHLELQPCSLSLPFDSLPSIPIQKALHNVSVRECLNEN
jgi:hypothetical protein